MRFLLGTRGDSVAASGPVKMAGFASETVTAGQTGAGWCVLEALYFLSSRRRERIQKAEEVMISSAPLLLQTHSPCVSTISMAQKWRPVVTHQEAPCFQFAWCQKFHDVLCSMGVVTLLGQES